MPDALDVDAVAAARKFHDAYERLAPSFGYETRTETRLFDPDTPNGKLMVAVCGEVVGPLLSAARERDALRKERDEAKGEVEAWQRQFNKNVDRVVKAEESERRARAESAALREQVGKLTEALAEVLGKFPADHTMQQLEPIDPPGDWQGRFYPSIRVASSKIMGWRRALSSAADGEVQRGA